MARDTVPNGTAKVGKEFGFATKSLFFLLDQLEGIGGGLLVELPGALTVDEPVAVCLLFDFVICAVVVDYVFRAVIPCNH